MNWQGEAGFWAYIRMRSLGFVLTGAVGCGLVCSWRQPVLLVADEDDLLDGLPR
jgi:hypothetical protein